MLAKLTLRRRWQLSIILGIALMILLCSGLWWWSGLPDRQLVYTVTAVGPLDQVAISPDSQFVATAAEDGTIQLWYLQDGAPLHSLNGHAGSAAIAFHPDSTQLVSAGADGTVRLWQVATGQSPTTLWPPAGVAPAPPAAALISQISADEPFTAVTFSPDGQLIAAGTGNRWVVIFQASTGQVVSIFQAYPELAKLSLLHPMEFIAVSPNNQWLLTNSFEHLKLWHLPERRLIQDFGPQKIQNMPFPPGLGVFAPDSTLLWLFYDGDNQLFTTPLIWSLDQQMLTPVPSGIEPTSQDFDQPNYAISAVASLLLDKLAVN